jgi:hypothetical protein
LLGVPAVPVSIGRPSFGLATTACAIVVVVVVGAAAVLWDHIVTSVAV